MALAQTANRVYGTHLGPWDIGQLDEVSLDVLRALASEAPQMRAGVAKVEARKQAIRQAHQKQYRH